MYWKALRLTIGELLRALVLWTLAVFAVWVLFEIGQRALDGVKASQALSLVCLALPVLYAVVVLANWIRTRYLHHLYYEQPEARQRGSGHAPE